MMMMAMTVMMMMSKNEAIKAYKVREGKDPIVLNHGGVRSASQCSASADSVHDNH